MKYRKKPVVIDAVQYDGTQESKLKIFGMGIPELGEDFMSDDLTINTLEGEMTAKPGDYIIKGVKGEFYPCKPDIFEATYGPAGEAHEFAGGARELLEKYFKKYGPYDGEDDQTIEALTQLHLTASDGYHTFDELYEHRLALTAALFNQWGALAKYGCHKSFKHYDGELAFGGGWFVVMATLPNGQISYHYPDKYWDKFNVAALPKAMKWDGHTPQDVIERLIEFVPEPGK